MHFLREVFINVYVVKTGLHLKELILTVTNLLMNVSHLKLKMYQ